jgi:hypothetical protein
MCSSETSVKFHRNSQGYIPEDGILRLENRSNNQHARRNRFIPNNFINFIPLGRPVRKESLILDTESFMKWRKLLTSPRNFPLVQNSELRHCVHMSLQFFLLPS